MDWQSTTVLCLAGTLVALGATPSQAAPTCFGEEATIVGTDRNERIEGTPGRDVIVGRGGLDRIFGRGGDDLICGNGFYIPEQDTHGSDYLYGGPGDDKIDGGKGDDAIFGGAGDDLLLAAQGAADLNFGDAIRGGAGNDVMVGSRMGDTFWPGPGRDIVRAKGSKNGSDSVRYDDSPSAISVDLRAETARGHGRDRLRDVEDVVGSPFNDEIFGSSEINMFSGGAGDDDLRGRGGDDLLYGQEGLDMAAGGEGNDYCVAETETSCEDG